jgi:primosomal protein N' (replication factor Y)
MPMNRRALVRVAVPVPLNTSFDYLCPEPATLPPVGARVRVPFGRGSRVGVVLEHPATSSVAAERLKPVTELLDDEPLLNSHLLNLLNCASRYYRHPIGEVIAAALPKALREGRPATAVPSKHWQLTPLGESQDSTALAKKAPRQAEALTLLRNGPLEHTSLREQGIPQAALLRLAEIGLINTVAPPAPEPTSLTTATGPQLTPQQTEALARLSVSAEFDVSLLFGVTGSGKTEVYLRLIEQRLTDHQQTPWWVPQTSLPPQLVAR